MDELRLTSLTANHQLPSSQFFKTKRFTSFGFSVRFFRKFVTSTLCSHVSFMSEGDISRFFVPQASQQTPPPPTAQQPKQAPSPNPTSNPSPSASGRQRRQVSPNTQAMLRAISQQLLVLTAELDPELVVEQPAGGDIPPRLQPEAVLVEQAPPQPQPRASREVLIN